MSVLPTEDVIRIEFYEWFESQFIEPADLTKKDTLLMYLSYRAGYGDGMFTQEHLHHSREELLCQA